MELLVVNVNVLVEINGKKYIRYETGAETGYADIVWRTQDNVAISGKLFVFLEKEFNKIYKSDA